MKIIYQNKEIIVKVSEPDIENPCGVWIERVASGDMAQIYMGGSFNDVTFWLESESSFPDCKVLQGDDVFVNGVKTPKPSDKYPTKEE